MNRIYQYYWNFDKGWFMSKCYRWNVKLPGTKKFVLFVKIFKLKITFTID